VRLPAVQIGETVVALVLAACSSGAPSATPSTPPAESQPTPTDVATVVPSPADTPVPRTMLVDTDVAADDLVALAFLIVSPQVNLAGITVSGTGEAHCAGGVDVVLRLLDRLDAPDIPVACGREMPLAGSHAFPDAWREHADQGSGLLLEATSRTPSPSTAVELITSLARDNAPLTVLALGPETNLADALTTDPDLAAELGPVFIMGGALHVPGNLVCCGAPEGNSVAEWNVYVDPRAANVVVDSGITPTFISLDGTNQVPLTPEFAARIMEPGAGLAGAVVAQLFTANPFMTDGSYFLWDPLAAELAAGHPIGTFSPASIAVEEAEGPESGFTRPTSGLPNIQFLTTIDPAAAEDTLLRVLNGR